MQNNASPHCKKVIYLKWRPLHWGSSLHLIKAVNVKIPITVSRVTADCSNRRMCVWEWNVWGFVLFSVIFLPLCDAPSCACTCANFSLAFSLHLFLFHLQWPHLLSQLKCEHHFLRMIPKPTSVSSVSSCSTLGIPTVTLSFSACRQTPASR